MVVFYVIYDYVCIKRWFISSKSKLWHDYDDIELVPEIKRAK